VIAAGLDRKPGIATGPRAALSNADWQTVRASCPPEEDLNPLDLAVATRLLDEPALYAKALDKTKILGMPVKQTAVAALPPP
jgi:hypothetical protein